MRPPSPKRAGHAIFLTALLLALSLLVCSCHARRNGPSIEFTRIPAADPGGPQKTGTIEGRVEGAKPGQRIVLYARSGRWFVQPFTDQPFTSIAADSTWKSSTHLGMEYAALLVDAAYDPPKALDVLPEQGVSVVAVAIVPGTPVFWRTWWFQGLMGLTAVVATLLLYRWRMRDLTHQLNLRFEERLAERTRIAQDLHDTLLQGVLSASMQLHVAVESVPADSPTKPALDRVLQLMAHVVEEGRTAVQGLRSPQGSVHDLDEAFSRVQQELALDEKRPFRVIVEGAPRPLHPLIRDEVYSIGREALVNSFRHSRASITEVELEYASNQLRVLVRDNGCGIDPQVLRSGRDGHWGLSGMRERAERIGARLKVWSRAGAGTEIELSVPGHIAFERPQADKLQRVAGGRDQIR